jgi:chemotaxis protein methyltransferase CheR
MAQLGTEMLTFFSNLIERETGIQYTTVNGHLLENRLRDLAQNMGYPDVDSLWKDVATRGLRPSEKEMVLDLATNNETSFFRDPEVFEFFKNEFIPKHTSQHNPVRIWCAATSTGQEPYSLAMHLSALRDAGVIRDYSLLATDFSERVLTQAKSGLYSQLEIQRGLPAPLMIRHFTQENANGSPLPKFRVKPDLGKHITFRRQNLLDPFQDRGPFDIIFCRNVLIYQDVESKRRIIAKLAECLKPGGFLILGGAESLLGLSDGFDMCLYGKACTYKLKQALKASA